LAATALRSSAGSPWPALVGRCSWLIREATPRLVRRIRSSVWRFFMEPLIPEWLQMLFGPEARSLACTCGATWSSRPTIHPRPDVCETQSFPGCLRRSFPGTPPAAPLRDPLKAHEAVSVLNLPRSHYPLSWTSWPVPQSLPFDFPDHPRERSTRSDSRSQHDLSFQPPSPRAPACLS